MKLKELNQFLFPTPFTITNLKGSKISSKFQLIFRIISLFIYIACIVVGLLTRSENVILLAAFQYLTFWGVVICFFYSLIILLCTCKYKTNEDVEKDKGTFALWKLAIVFFQLSLIQEIIIALFYWSGGFVNDPSLDLPTGLLNSILSHGVSLVFIVLEAVFGKMAYFFSNWIIEFCFQIFYLLVNFICEMARGKPVYRVLSWKNAAHVCLAPLLLIFSIFIQQYIFCCLKIRLLKSNLEQVHSMQVVEQEDNKIKQVDTESNEKLKEIGDSS